MDVTARVDAPAVVSPPVPCERGGRSERSTTRALLTVLVLGVTVAGLTWRTTDAGVGWLLTETVLVVAIVAGVAGGRPGAAGWMLAAATVWLAGGASFYASDWAEATALPASLVTLGALALVAARRIRAQSLADVGGASLDALRALPCGIVDAAKMPVHAVGPGARAHALGILRGALVGVPLAGIFTLLLSADSRFRHAIGRLVDRTGDGVELAVWTSATTAGLLVAFAVMRRLERPREPAAPPGWSAWPYRFEGDAPVRALPAAPTGPRVRVLTWGVVLAHVVGVFAVYVGANAGSLFVGHAHVRAPGTPSYAAYLHEGFTQVSVATLLAVACVVAGHVLLRPRVGQARVTGGRALVGIELALLGLVGITLASCAHRLALYEEAYGYTYLRLGVWLLQLGVAGLLAMTAARCLARAWRGWGSALAWSAVAFAALAGSLDADGWIARRNVARARAGAELDTGYLATLSEDARGVLPQVAALDVDAAAALAEAWNDSAAAHRRHGWRAWRGLGVR
jgi:hypothetical protein